MERPNLLFVDDEAHNLRALERLFFDEDYTLHFSLSGEAALEKLESCPFALVVLDVMMPGMDGIEVCSRIKEKDENIMVLILSSRSSIEDRMKGYTVQADDYLSKPFDPKELIAKVNILVRLHNAIAGLEKMNQELETKVKKRTDELIVRERQAIAGKMVRGIVHNFRGPLTVALASAQLTGIHLGKLRTCAEEDDATCQVMDSMSSSNNRVLEAMDRMTNMVDSLLIQGGDNPAEKMQPVDLNELVRDEYHFLMSDVIQKNQVKVSLELAENLPVIVARYSDFSQVFYNIVKNACEAMSGSDNRQLIISTRHSSSGIRLSFADTGPGIDPDQLKRVFDPFFSTKSADNTKESGSGLGLFISSRLMAGYQAPIAVIPKDPCGLMFTVTIPLSNVYVGNNIDV